MIKKEIVLRDSNDVILSHFDELEGKINEDIQYLGKAYLLKNFSR